MNTVTSGTRATLGRNVELDSPCSDCVLDNVRAGDAAACEAFVRTHTPRMLAVAKRYFRCEHDRADAVQDAFVSAFRALGDFAGDADIATWLYRIVVNSCLMKLRSRSRRPSASIDDFLPTFDETGHHAQRVVRWDEDVDQRIGEESTLQKVREAIEQLPDSYREVLVLRDVEGFDTENTAAILGMTAANVKVRLHRSRQALRTLLDQTLQPTRFPTRC